MNRMVWLAMVVIAAVGITAHAQGTAARTMLEAAKKAEVIDGDLKTAIERYGTIAETDGVERSVAAEALVRMAECYQKLGRAESRNAYERVVREYADQKEFATLARTRLANTTAAPAILTNRRVATVPVGGIGYGTVSPDGRYFPYTNWTNGDLYLRDLLTGDDRRLTNVSGLNDANSQFAVQAAISKDGRQIAYHWANGARAELRLLNLVVAGRSSQPRTIFSNDDVRQVWPDDWSPDGARVAVQLRRHDKTAQLGVVNVGDGSLHVVKSVEWRAATRLMFSPDGNYLAYDVPASDTADQRDVFILAVDGSREIPVVVHPANDTVMGWSSDGQSLLFASDRSGSRGLWRVAVAEGRPGSSVELIKPNLEGAPLGVAKDGALYSLMHHPSFSASQSANVQIASFDFDAGTFLSDPATAVQSFVDTNNFPAWSPDGSSLAYVSARETAAASGGTGARTLVIGIRSTSTGQTREIRPTFNLYPAPIVRWSADGRSLVTHGRDSRGRSAIFRIDVQTGAHAVLVMSPDDGDVRWPTESRDGKHLYYVHGYTGTDSADRPFRLVARELATGADREILSSRQGNPAVTALNIFAPSLSPDGRQFLFLSDDAAAGTTALLRVGVEGGTPIEVMRVTSPERVVFQSWTPDSRAVLLRVSAPGRQSELWRVPVAGGERRKLDLQADNMTAFSVHPDGRQIAFGLTGPARDHEIWVLENFLPASPPPQPSVRK